MQGKDDECRPFGSGAWILIHDETPGKPPPSFHLSWNMFSTWDQKHLHFNDMFYRLTQHLTEAMRYHRKHVTAHNSLLFHFRRRCIKNSDFVLYHRFPTPRRPPALICYSVCNPRWSTPHRFWYYVKRYYDKLTFVFSVWLTSMRLLISWLSLFCNASLVLFISLLNVT